MKNKSNGSKTNQNTVAAAAIAGATSPNRQIRTFEESTEEADANLNEEQRAMVEIGRSMFAAVIQHAPPLGTPEHASYKEGEHDVESRLGLPADSLDPRP